MTDQSFEYWICSPAPDGSHEVFSQVRVTVEEGTATTAIMPFDFDPSDVPDFFSNMILTGVNLTLLTKIFGAAKHWLASRPEGEITLTLCDGFELKASGLTLEEATQQLRDHAASQL